MIAAHSSPDRRAAATGRDHLIQRLEFATRTMRCYQLSKQHVQGREKMTLSLRKFWDIWAIRLDFGPDEQGPKLTLTFSFLSGLVRVLTFLTAIWAISAGVLQSGRLVEFLPELLAKSASTGFWTRNSDWLAPLVGIPVYAAKAFSSAMLIGLAAASIGALLGFLFGVPRPISDLGASPVITTDAPPSPTTVPNAAGQIPAAAPSGPGWQASTNLTQVSDWLTKIIVGVGLVEATSIYQGLSSLSADLGSMLFDGMFGSRLVVPSLMISGAILGFLYAYLFTQLFLAALMAYSAVEVSGRGPWFARSIATLAGFPTASSTIAGLMTRGNKSEPIPHASPPTSAQSEAAENLEKITLESIDDPATIQAWARARALQRNYNEAARGYRKLLRFVSTPDVLAEAARVLDANSESSEAKKLLDRAVTERAAVSPDVRSRIVFDAANLALYDPPPGGFTRALELLDDGTLSVDPQGSLHVLRACAFAQKYKFDGDRSTAIDKQELRQKILQDVDRSLNINPNNRTWVHYLWDPNVPGKASPGSPDRDDDLEQFYDFPEFRDIITSSGAPSTKVNLSAPPSQ